MTESKEIKIAKTPLHFRNKRKKAVASCRMIMKNAQTKGIMQVIVNEKPFSDYFSSLKPKASKIQQFEEYSADLDSFIIKTTGGGICAQLEAVISSIAKALTSLNPELKKVLKEKRLYKHDARQHERNKPGLVKRRKDSPYRKR